MVKWTPKSQNDLDEIREYIAKNFNVELAIGTVDQLVDFTENTLKSNPLAGAMLASNPLFFKLIYEGNSIFYCENQKDHDLYIVYVQPRGARFRDDRLNSGEVA